MESWGDQSPRPGVRSIVQPTLRPLHDTRAFGDTLIESSKELGDAVASQLPSGSFRTVLEEAWSDTDFRQFFRLSCRDIYNHFIAFVDITLAFVLLERFGK